MHVLLQKEARSLNHCCRGKAKSVTYSECECVCVFVCSLSYTCKAHAPYCHLQSIRHHHIFPHYFIKVTIFGKKLLNIKCVRFDFSTTSS
jgi:hypothetical protein